MKRKNILILSNIGKAGKDVWTVIEYKKTKKYNDKTEFVWLPAGRNMIFSSKADAILKLAIEGAELYEMKHDHKLHAFSANEKTEFKKVR